MNSLTRIKLLDILRSTSIIILVAMLLVLVSWSGGVYNDIKNFDVIKNSKKGLLDGKFDVNASKFFTFSKNKITSGYVFTLGKMVSTKDYLKEKFVISYFDNNSTEIPDSNSSLSVYNGDVNTSIVIDNSVIKKAIKYHKDSKSKSLAIKKISNKELNGSVVSTDKKVL